MDKWNGDTWRRKTGGTRGKSAQKSGKEGARKGKRGKDKETGETR